MSKQFFDEKRPHNGKTYNEYFTEWEESLEKVNPDELDAEAKSTYEYTKMNMQRTKRIHKTYTVSDELKAMLSKITKEQIWMVLTENWCGDSAQTLPYIALAAHENSNIKFRILNRDENLDIMDQYLTEKGARSIPKLVAFDTEGNELFQWGPRPKEAQKLVQEEMAKGREKQDVYKDLHLWYGRNRGQEIEKELMEILKDIA